MTAGGKDGAQVMLIAVDDTCEPFAGDFISRALSDGRGKSSCDSQAEGLTDAERKRRNGHVGNSSVGGVAVGAIMECGVNTFLGRDCRNDSSGEDGESSGELHFVGWKGELCVYDENVKNQIIAGCWFPFILWIACYATTSCIPELEQIGDLCIHKQPPSH